MTGNTERFIRRLAEHLEPVRPLPPPWIRTGAWLALAVPYVAVVVLVMSPRDDLPSKMLDVRFAIEQAAALATGIAAAVAAFATVVPGYSKLLVLPLLPLALWVGSVGQRCVQDWLGRIVSLQADWVCLPAIILAGALPAFVMAVMLRRGVPLTPRATAALGALAAAALGNVGLRMFHPQDASVTVLVWQCGTVLGLSALAGCIGRCFLYWRAIGADAHGPVVAR